MNKPTHPLRPSSTPKRGPGRPQVKGNRGVVQHRRLRLVVSLVSIVVVLGALLIAVISNSGDDETTNSTVTAQDASAIVSSIATLPQSLLDGVGAGAVTSDAVPVSGTPISIDGKPEVLYVGAEYCPFCAAERWPLLIALSRFGAFADVGVTRSSSVDVFPNTATVSFHGSSYSSEYLAFTAVEVATNEPDGSGGYKPLDTLTAAQRAVVDELSPGGGIPFIDFGGRYLISGATFDAGVLQGLTAAEIAATLSSPDSDIAQSVLGAANSITATLCELTANQPADVCS